MAFSATSRPKRQASVGYSGATSPSWRIGEAKIWALGFAEVSVGWVEWFEES